MPRLIAKLPEETWDDFEKRRDAERAADAAEVLEARKAHAEETKELNKQLAVERAQKERAMAAERERQRKLDELARRRAIDDALEDEIQFRADRLRQANSAGTIHAEVDVA